MRLLVHNLASLLRGSGARITPREGRLFVRCEETTADAVEGALSHLAGITGYARARETTKTVETVVAACLDEAKEAYAAGARTFKVESRRVDKRFPLHSYDLICAAADAVLTAMPFKVDVHHPDVTIRVEIREKAYIYGREKGGLRGLPVGCAGRGLLLLSGGIDSPVAGYMMALRGMTIRALYFHAYPYTGDEAKEKVKTLARLLARWTLHVRLFIVNFTEVEQAIQRLAPTAWSTVLMRMAMFDTASRLAERTRCRALITGESLSQVASQTVENIAAAESMAKLPVLRPLIGLDKEDIIRRAMALGTYSTSILPYPDCCVLFSPEHPILHAPTSEALERYNALNLDTLITSALAKGETINYNAPEMHQ
jgi:thiamine biosynthesis protein ThiI